MTINKALLRKHLLNLVKNSVHHFVYFGLCSVWFVFFIPNPGADLDVDAAAHHITSLFSACNGDPDKAVFHHFTTATDTANVQVVFHMITDQIFRENLAVVELL